VASIAGIIRLSVTKWRSQRLHSASPACGFMSRET
jgi:hypothetical protein